MKMRKLAQISFSLARLFKVAAGNILGDKFFHTPSLLWKLVKTCEKMWNMEKEGLHSQNLIKPTVSPSTTPKGALRKLGRPGWMGSYWKNI